MKKVDIEKEPCSECGGKLQKKFISQDFEREGITVKLSGVAAMVCYACKTTLVPLRDRPNLILLKDEEVEPMELKECPRCGNEYNIHDKEGGMTITQRPQYRA